MPKQNLLLSEILWVKKIFEILVLYWYKM